MTRIKGRETVTIIRRTITGEDDYGNPTTGKTEINVRGCLVAWGSATVEENLFQSKDTVDATIVFPHGTELYTDDIFVLRGERYEASGESVQWIPQVGWNTKLQTLQGVRRSNG